MPWEVCSILDERGRLLAERLHDREACRVIATFPTAAKAEAAIVAYRKWAVDNDMVIPNDCLFMRRVD